MFVNQGIQPVTVVFNNAKNCFLHLPATVISQLSLQENQALELSWAHGSPVFLSWTRSRSASKPEEHRVELCRQLGEKLGLKEGEQGFLRPCQQVSSVHQVFVEPLSSDDWEILELHSAALEQQLLDQIRVVFKDAVFPVWVDQRTAVYIRIVSLAPAVPHGRLEQFTELVVSPKTRPGASGFPHPSAGTSRNPPPYGHPTPDPPRSSLPSPGEGDHPSPAPAQRWEGIAHLKGLVRSLFTGARDPAAETSPSVPDLTAPLSPSVHRVCHRPPNALCTINPGAAAVVHLFPWNQTTNGSAPSQSAVTYGLLSKIPSPQEARDGAKRAADSKKNAGVLKDSQNWGEIHSGRVWITQHLATGLKIAPHSMVRIQPVESTVKVASGIRLQPLEQQPEESDDAIQTAFLDWLHSQSHEPLACLTARSSILLLHGPNAKLELALTVLQPQAQSDPPDQLFLLAPSVLQKAGIQVDREQVTTDTALEAVADVSYTDLPLLGTLGGAEQLSKAAFQFMSHSLLGSPLSRELVAIGQGLRGGGLIITGAKGSGKSSLSRALCRKAGEELDAHVEVVDCKRLQGKRAETVRQSLEETFERARWRQPSVVLLDDLDHVTGAATSPDHEHGPEAQLQQSIAQSLLDLVDDLVVRSSLVCLVVTSQTEHSLHPSLTQPQGVHFFQGFLRIQPPDQAQRAEILRCLVIQKTCLLEDTPDTLDLGAVAKETDGYLARDLALLLERAVHASAMREEHSGPGDRLCLRWSHFEQALKGFTPPSMWGVKLQTPPGAGLDRVGGLREVRQELMDTVLLPAKYPVLFSLVSLYPVLFPLVSTYPVLFPLVSQYPVLFSLVSQYPVLFSLVSLYPVLFSLVSLYPVLFSRLPIRHRSGVLLYGAPGTGKTLLAGAVARDSGMNFISIKGPELLSKYIGASEQGVRDVFQRAQAAKPCVLFFDEFDSLAPRRGHDSTGVTDRVVNQLLTQLDGVEGLQGVYVLAATSRPDMIDPALLRPGRLDKSLYCGPPDAEARVEILQALSEGLSLAPDVDLGQLACATELFTGADLKALLYNAQLEAVHLASPRTSPLALQVSTAHLSLAQPLALQVSTSASHSPSHCRSVPHTSASHSPSHCRSVPHLSLAQPLALQVSTAHLSLAQPLALQVSTAHLSLAQPLALQVSTAHLSLAQPLALQEPAACGSDSEGSLSSMVFLNNSSCSEDSAGEPSLPPSLPPDRSAEPRPAEPQPGDSSAWRLYFGSSYGSELGVPSPSAPDSLCFSGPGSTTQDSGGGVLAREPGGTLPPACMPSLQDGYRELAPEQLQRLLLDVNVMANSYRRTKEEGPRSRSGSSGSGLLLSQAHLTSALAQTRPSLGTQDWQRFSSLYEAFRDPRGRGAGSSVLMRPGHRVTLA
ncbi:hypothetical protein NHX12_023191 [Muraenolepis orangiensis]|uniref:Peroxisomal ATPase PEX1 n=1 Tax=Muraenolepis orangiensis TaxID=630683 RepID=A0A9Q0EN87_9TELE|nr:hypothetical protein NHX12_023191 [Muraenolepis orangiensis]